MLKMTDSVPTSTQIHQSQDRDKTSKETESKPLKLYYKGKEEYVSNGLVFGKLGQQDRPKP
ncbi:unnamed protein product [Sphenostylis stenocarpa]|uniref:Uncharacterized protein n=1 Tax=Sphenostylis stenocarpa TaxID=92480 RepID=A0AA86RPN9_9FABA|nr:unnamed protein product [Sphenostylis stenocarpa]